MHSCVNNNTIIQMLDSFWSDVSNLFSNIYVLFLNMFTHQHTYHCDKRTQCFINVKYI